MIPLECNHLEVTLQISVSIQPNFWEDFFEASFFPLLFVLKHQFPWKENVGSSAPKFPWSQLIRWLKSRTIACASSISCLRFSNFWGGFFCLRGTLELGTSPSSPRWLRNPNFWEISPKNIWNQFSIRRKKSNPSNQPTKSPKNHQLNQPFPKEELHPWRSHPSPLKNPLGRWKF